MLITGHSLTIIWFLLDVTDSHLSEDEKMMDDTFRSRSNEDWASAWHQETHIRCRENIQRHLYWACSKDIYKLSRRSNHDEEEESNEVLDYPFIDIKTAKTFLRYRRGAVRPSISNECCSPVGCTWEEYAEYCTSNKRIRKYRS